MRIHQRVVAAALGASAVVGLAQWPTQAQEPAAPKSGEAAPKAKTEHTHRVPPYFGKIALTKDQTSRIYSIQDKHQEKIEALEKQIATERAAFVAECEAVLNKTQKELLDNLRREGTKPTTTAKPVASAKPTS